MGSRAAWEEIKKTNPDIPQHSINPRFPELIREGVMKEIGEYECPYTEETVTCYDVTSKVLVKRKFVSATPTKARQLRDYLDDLDATAGDKKIAVRRVTKRIRKAMTGIGF
jgi:RecB family endonuclease NucS